MGFHLSHHRVNGIFNNNKRKPYRLSQCFNFSLRSLKSLSLFSYSAPLQVTCTGFPDIVTAALPGR